MAKCKATFKRFKWNRGGYIAVQNSAGVQSLVASKATPICATANAMAVSKSGKHLPNAYKTKQVQGKFARGYIVANSGADGWFDNLRNNTLKKASNC